MDPLSSAASIITVLQLSTDVVKYIIRVTGHSKDRKRLREEVLACESILLCLQDNVDDPNQESHWIQKVQALEESPETPLYRLSVILNVIKTKLEPKRGLEKVKAALKWPFDEKELQMLIEAIEREKSLLQLALTDECRLLIKAIKNNSSESQKLLLELIDMIKETSTSLENNMQELRKQNISTDQQAILNWLSPIDYAAQQSDFLSRRQEGTCQWLLESTEFESWLNNRNQILFCPGIPGAGKTILTSIVIEKLYNHFQNYENVGIAYLYCNFRRKDEQNTLDLLANVLKQLTQSLPTVPECLKSLYEKMSSKGARPSFEDISKALTSVVALQDRTFVLVDALDECQPAARNTLKLLTFLFKLQTDYGSNIFATSRFMPEIVEKFNSNGCRSIEIRASDEDLRRYLQGHMSQLPRFVQTKKDLQEQIVTGITKFVDGMFLLAQISLNSLEDKITPKAMKTALTQLQQDASIPNGDEKKELLGRAYGQAMQRIQSQKAGFRALAERVLSWIICAKRQLTTVELQHALAIELDELALDMDNIPEVGDMVSVCAGLVTIDEHTSIIRLVHYTLQEYFEKTWDSWFPGATIAMTKACVTYLSFKAFESGWCQSDTQFEAQLQSYPLYDYAARFWGSHGYENSKETDYLIVEFLKKKTNVAGANQAMMVSPRFRYRGYSQKIPSQLNGMHIAAYFGLKDVLLLLLEDGFDPNSKDSYGNTAILWAASRGHEAVVQQLLETEGVNPDSKARYNRTPLSWAAAKGHDATIKMLLDDSRVDVNSLDNNGHTPLWWAAMHGWEEVVKLLLASDQIDREIKDSRGQTVLDIAKRYHRQGVIKLLVGKEDLKTAVWRHQNEKVTAA